MITTLDVDLQQTASDAIGKHRGAVIVMEPDTGKILTMVSQPISMRISSMSAGQS